MILLILNFVELVALNVDHALPQVQHALIAIVLNIELCLFLIATVWLVTMMQVLIFVLPVVINVQLVLVVQLVQLAQVVLQGQVFQIVHVQLNIMMMAPLIVAFLVIIRVLLV